MIGRTHDAAAFAALLGVYLVTPPASMSLATILIAVLANQLGGIAPDIDQPTAPLWRNLPIGGPIGRIFDKLLGGHRFLTHSLIGVVLFGILAHFLLLYLHPIMLSVDSTLVWWAFMIGMLSHLVMDSFTKEGVPWLLPLPVKVGFPPIKRLRLTTGKLIEKFLILPALVVIIIVLISSHYAVLEAAIHHVT
jgi:inner membrane protein